MQRSQGLTPTRHALVRRRRGEAGFTFIELMIALGIFAVGLLGLAIMQLTAIDTAKRADELSLANNIATAVLEDTELMEPTTLVAGSDQQTFGRNGSTGGTYFTATRVIAGSGNTRNVTVTVSWNSKSTGNIQEGHSVTMRSVVGPR